MIRPGALKFLYEMKYHYEIVVFTAAIPEVSILLLINLLVRWLDHRFYRPGEMHNPQTLQVAHSTIQRLRVERHQETRKAS